MVGDGLNLLHAEGIGLGEMEVYVAQRLEEVLGDVLQLWQWQLAKCYEILYLHADAVTYECVLGEIVGQGICLPSVTAINRRDGRKV